VSPESVKNINKYTVRFMIAYDNRNVKSVSRCFVKYFIRNSHAVLYNFRKLLQFLLYIKTCLFCYERNRNELTYIKEVRSCFLGFKRRNLSLPLLLLLFLTGHLLRGRHRGHGDVGALCRRPAASGRERVFPSGKGVRDLDVLIVLLWL